MVRGFPVGRIPGFSWKVAVKVLGMLKIGELLGTSKFSNFISIINNYLLPLKLLIGVLISCGCYNKLNCLFKLLYLLIFFNDCAWNLITAD